MIENLPANAGDTDSIPGPGRSCMPWATKPVDHNYWSLWEATAKRNLQSGTREWPPLATTRESNDDPAPNT